MHLLPNRILSYRNLSIIGFCSLGALAFMGTNIEKSVSTMPKLAATHTNTVNLIKLPLMFESNQGQTNENVRFITRTGDFTMYFTPSEMVFDFRTPMAINEAHGKMKQFSHSSYISNSVIRMQFVDANLHATVTGKELLPAKSNYFIGSDSTKWQTNVSNYAKVNYQNLYNGIDMVFYGKNNQLEYDIRVAPGADPHKAQLQFTGNKKIVIDEKGDLKVYTQENQLLFMHKPVIYQMIDGKKKSVTGQFVLDKHNHIGFSIGQYDKAKELIIDPVLAYSTYLGGSEDNAGLGIAVDNQLDPSSYVTGYTKSTDFPVVGAYQSVNKGPGRTAFVTKINNEGSAIIYSTYLGGSGGNDEGFAIAVDNVSSAYITGETNSKDFPVKNPFQATNRAKEFSAFVTKLNPEGNDLVYSTYLGGSGDNQEGNAIAVDHMGFAYITGETTSIDFPVKNAFQSTNKGPKFTAYLTKLNTLGTDLVFSTYIGGSGGQDEGNGIAVDTTDQSICITGETNSKDFPTFNAIQPTPKAAGAGQTGFLTHFTSDGSALHFSTYYGGSGGNDYPTTIDVDSRGDFTFGGYTNSLDFPLKNAFQTTNRGSASGRGFNGFVARINHEGNVVFYSSYLGGSGGDDRVMSLRINKLFVTIVVGWTNSTDFPLLNPVQATNNGPNITGFGTRVNDDGTLRSSSYFGGSGGEDRIMSVAFDDNLSSYSTGLTNSPDLPLRFPIQSSHPAKQMAMTFKVAA